MRGVSVYSCLRLQEERKEKNQRADDSGLASLACGLWRRGKGHVVCRSGMYSLWVVGVASVRLAFCSFRSSGAVA